MSSKITLVSVTGLPDASIAALSLAHCLNQMPACQAVLCCPHPPLDLDSRIKHVPIKAINYHEYSWFILFMLWRVIETEFALIVQDDGWILDSSNWTDEFLNYDYIGAPIHLAKVTDLDSQSSEWVRGFVWAREINNPNKKLDIIQNGGFSLRSQKLMRALCELNMSVEVPPPTIVGDTPLSMGWHNDCLYEDVQLSGVLKDKLIAHGINFAPPGVARKFSIEHAGPVLHDNFSYSSLFGHHSKLRKLKSINSLTIEYSISQEEIDTIHGERNIHDLFLSLNYHIQYKR